MRIKLFYAIGLITTLIHLSLVVANFGLAIEIPQSALFVLIASIIINISILIDAWKRKLSFTSNWLRTETYTYRDIFLVFFFLSLSFWYFGDKMIYSYLYLIVSLLWITSALVRIISWDTKLKYHRHSFIFKSKKYKYEYFNKVKEYLKSKYDVDLEKKGNKLNWLNYFISASKPTSPEKILIADKDLQTHTVSRGIIVSGVNEESAKKLIEEIDEVIESYPNE